jgi:hypothetical protein
MIIQRPSDIFDLFTNQSLRQTKKESEFLMILFDINNFEILFSKKENS